MSDLHELCRLQQPLNADTIKSVRFYLKNGVPATYTLEDAHNFAHGVEAEAETATTPLHLLAANYRTDFSEEEVAVVEEMAAALLEYGAGWCLTDLNNDTPGCILVKRGLEKSVLYRQIVDAGVRAEILLRKVSEFDMEIIEVTDDIDHEAFGAPESPEKRQDVVLDAQDAVTTTSEPAIEEKEPLSDEGALQNDVSAPEEPDAALQKETEQLLAEYRHDPAESQLAYLATPLEYVDGALVTKEQKDGVMMAWESDLMRLGCEALFKGGNTDEGPDPEVNVLNIGFGMGIIDTMIAKKGPTKHYICEAHPDVLRKLREDGWYDKPNVVVLEGRWQDNLDALLSSGVFFNGIYYDTFSEHYLDMLELFDYIVGLLKPHGVFSFFNGLGADRQVVYDVYRRLVELDLANYGLQVNFSDVPVPKETLIKTEGEADKSVWDDVKRSYWSCPVYYHPEARFIDI